MKQEVHTGSLSEYHNLLKEAKALEFTNTVLAKKKYLEAASMFFLLSCTDTERKEEYLQLANAAYASQVQLSRKYGQVVLPNGYKVRPLGSISYNTTGVTNLTQAQSASLPQGFTAVYGLEDIKEELLLKIIAPLKDPETFSWYNKQGKTGILMYGPPGCGKSFIAETIAKQAGASFIHLKASDIKSKWVGETEKNIADLFERARREQPAIIFIDEFESIGRSRDATSQTFEKNFVSQLLTEMDGLGTKGQRLIVIAATNEPWEVDNALLRSGRLGTKLFVPPPSLTVRRQILESECKKKPTEENIDLDTLAEKTKGFATADVITLTDAAAEEAIKEYFKTGQRRKISMDNFNTALKHIKPVTKQWFNNATRHVHEKNLQEEYPEVLNQNIT